MEHILVLSDEGLDAVEIIEQVSVLVAASIAQGIGQLTVLVLLFGQVIGGAVEESVVELLEAVAGVDHGVRWKWVRTMSD